MERVWQDFTKMVECAVGCDVRAQESPSMMKNSPMLSAQPLA
jgi:hypothetical protein